VRVNDNTKVMEIDRRKHPKSGRNSGEWQLSDHSFRWAGRQSIDIGQVQVKTERVKLTDRSGHSASGKHADPA